MCAPAAGCRSTGATPSCGASMRRRRRCWSWRSRSATSSAQRGFKNLVPWSRGVDIAAFKPQPRQELSDPRPIWLYAGRLAVEKNIKAFLDLDLPGTKWVVGGGPQHSATSAALQACALLRPGRHRGAVVPLRPVRLLRLPEPHRHLRPGHGRGAGLGRAGRGLPRARPARCRDHAQGWRARTKTCAPPALPPSPATPPTAAPTPRPSPGRNVPGSSATPCARSRAVSGSP